MTYFDLSDPTFDVTSAQVHAARDESWYVETNWGWAVLRYAEVSALLRDRRFRQGNARWPAQNGIHSGLFSDWWQETLLSLEGDDHARIRRLHGAGLPQQDDRGDAAALPGAGQRADRRLRRPRVGGVHLRVRRAVRRPHHLRAARAARGQLAPGRPLGRRPRRVVLDRRRQPGAPDRGGAERSLRLRRRDRRRPSGAPSGRPGDDAGAGLRRRRPAVAPRARRGPGVPGLRRHGDHPQPARPRAADPARAPRPVAAARRAARPRRAGASRR